MSDIKVRADELCGKHVGMYYEGREIFSIRTGRTVSVYGIEAGPNVEVLGEFDAGYEVTLSDTPTPDLPTEPGALVSASATNGQRHVLMRRLEDYWSTGRDSFDTNELSDPVELVAVPKKEYEALAEAVHGYANRLSPAIRLVHATDALESSLS